MRMYQQSRGNRNARPDPPAEQPSRSASVDRPRGRATRALRVNGRILVVDALPAVTELRDRERRERSPAGGEAAGGACPRRRRRHVVLAYGSLVLAAGLFAAVCATDGEIPAVLTERVHAGCAKGALRVAAEKRAANGGEAAESVTSSVVRRPRGLPWLEGRWREKRS